MGAANNSKTECALFFGFDECRCGAAGSGLCAFGGLALYSAEFFGVCEDEIHVLRPFQQFFQRCLVMN